MTPTLRVAVWSATAAVAGSGLAYAWMAYCLTPADPMDLANHPWQPTMLQLHVLTAPVWLVAFGALWHAHVWPKLCSAAVARRRSGIALASLALVMAASGYLLQTAVDESMRVLWVVTHVASSLAWLFAFGLHLLGSRRRADSRAASSASRT